MTKIQSLVDEAQAFRDQAVRDLAAVPDIESLELMRLRVKDEELKQAIETVLLLRKRSAKAEFERSDRVADLCDKASLPIGAGFPGFVAVLVSQNVVPANAVRVLIIASYIVGGALWLALRCAAAWYGNRSKAGIAKLGKVD